MTVFGFYSFMVWSRTVLSNSIFVEGLCSSEVLLWWHGYKMILTVTESRAEGYRPQPCQEGSSVRFHCVTHSTFTVHDSQRVLSKFIEGAYKLTDCFLIGS